MPFAKWAVAPTGAAGQPSGVSQRLAQCGRGREREGQAAGSPSQPSASAPPRFALLTHRHVAVVAAGLCPEACTPTLAGAFPEGSGSPPPPLSFLCIRVPSAFQTPGTLPEGSLRFSALLKTSVILLVFREKRRIKVWEPSTILK